MVVFAVVSAVRARPSDDYPAVGTTVRSVVYGLIVPESITAGAILAIALGLGWWRIVTTDRQRGGPRWAALAPALLVLVALGRLPFIDWSAKSVRYFLLLAVATLLIGVFEEFLVRGVLVVGLRRRMSEPWVWGTSSLVFGLLHLLNILAGAAVATTIVQVVFAASFGSALYVARRTTRTIAVPVFMHALWDFGALGVIGTGGLTAGFGALIGLGLLGLVTIGVLVFGLVAGVFVALRDNRPRRLAARWRTVPPRASLEVGDAGHGADTIPEPVAAP